MLIWTNGCLGGPEQGFKSSMIPKPFPLHCCLNFSFHPIAYQADPDLRAPLICTENGQNTENGFHCPKQGKSAENLL